MVRLSAWFRVMAFVSLALVSCGTERGEVPQGQLEDQRGVGDASVDGQGSPAESQSQSIDEGEAEVPVSFLFEPTRRHWEERSPPTSPSPRFGHVMAYDSEREKTVLVGGSTGNTIVETWEWDGSTWKRVATAGPPYGSYAMAYDSRRKVMVLLASAATWEWDGKAWTQVTTTGIPTHGGKAMVYDSARGKTVVYGGWYNCQLGYCESTDTWEWDGESWTKVATSGPPYRAFHAMAYDSARKRVVLFGSRISRASGDTWEWDGTSWAQVATTGPVERTYPAMAYDSVRGKVVLYGGTDRENRLLADTWEWDGVSWSEVMVPAPSARQRHAMVYDSAQNRIVLFGGHHAAEQRSGETWEYYSVRHTCSCPGGGNCASAECSTGYCVDGICCDPHLLLTSVPNCLMCARCDSPTNPGVCTPVVNAQDPDSCAGTMMCGPDKNCGPANGQPCTPGVTPCASGHCVDGYCCDLACAGECERCDHSDLGWSDTPNGTCAPVPSGYPGSPSCGAYSCNGASSTCSASSCTSDLYCAWDHYCDRMAKCSPRKAQGDVCNTSAGADCLVSDCRVCTTGHCVDGHCCDEPCVGACSVCNVNPGVCEPAAEGAQGSPSCAPYLCDGVSRACRTSCDSDADCAKSAYCDAATGACEGEHGLGALCTRDAECQSGFCVDGVCCNSACEGQCSACDAPGTEGTCAPIVGEPHGGRPACASDDENVCATTLCDGKNGSSCAGFVGPGQSCRAASCEVGTETLSASCDGKGACPSLQTKKCEPYVCAGEACGKAPCESDVDCAPKFRCAAPEGKTERDCLPREAATCDGHVVVAADGVSTTDCSPYKCESSGVCKTGCGSIDDCAAPNVCDVNGQCLPLAYDAETAIEAGGCGCRVVASSGGASWKWAGVAGVVAMAWRRRRGARTEA